MLRLTWIALLLVASVLTWFLLSDGSNRPDSARTDTSENGPQHTRIADASSANLQRTRSEETPDATPPANDASPASPPKPITIDGRELDADEASTLRRMKAYLQKAELSTEFPQDMSTRSWSALVGMFNERRIERNKLAESGQRLAVAAGGAKFDNGDYTIEDHAPKWKPDGVHLAMSSFEDPLTGRRKYKVVRVMPGECPESDWIRNRVQNMDQDIALIVRSFVDRL